jgi:hypothetical protein
MLRSALSLWMAMVLVLVQVLALVLVGSASAQPTQMGSVQQMTSTSFRPFGLGFDPTAGYGQERATSPS